MKEEKNEISNKPFEALFTEKMEKRYENDPNFGIQRKIRTQNLKERNQIS